MTNALGRRFVEKGHELVISFSRDRGKLEKSAKDIGGGTRAGSPREAAAFGDVLLLATGWDGAAGALEAAGPLEGKVVWSIVNPLKADQSGLRMGTTTSGSEELARLAKGAAFVGGFPPFADVLTSPSTHFGSERPTLFYFGDSEAAKQKVVPLFDALDVDPVDCGPLHAARFVEPTMFLLVHLAYGRKLGQVGARLLRR